MAKAKTLAVIMDPIESIKPYKDTTLLLMLAAQKRGWVSRGLSNVQRTFDPANARPGMAGLGAIRVAQPRHGRHA
jgi:glutathione synthase/RimK-type ligase-like ATP-grasp enzyme